MKIQYDKLVDAKGLKCPHPLMLVKQCFKNLEKGQIVLLEATDPHTDLDLQVWCDRFHHKIISTKELENVFLFWIKS